MNLTETIRAGAAHRTYNLPSRIPILILLATLPLPHANFAITRGSNDATSPEAAIVVQVLNPNGSCTGILLTPTAILTAKHCVTGDTFSNQNIFGGNGGKPAAQPPFTIRVGNPIGNGTGPIETHTTVGQTLYGDNGPVNDQERGRDVAILWLDPTAQRGSATAPAFGYARIVRQNLASPVASGGDDSEGGHYSVPIVVSGWSPISGHDPSYRQVAYYGEAYHYPGFPDGGPGTPSGQFWVHAQGDGNIEPGDSGGPLFWQMPDGTRQILGVAESTFQWPLNIDGFDCTFNRCDIWTDVTRGGNADWIRKQIVDTSRSTAWLIAHGRTDYWKGEVDYTGPCNVARDSDCDHWYNEHDDCPNFYDPDQTRQTCPAPPLPVPVVTGISPSSGTMLGGTAVTVTGIGFNPQGLHATTIYFGNTSVDAYCYDSTRCDAASPPSLLPLTVDVTVSVADNASIGYGGRSLPTPADRFTYLGPAVTGIEPSAGPELGGTDINIFGMGFVQGMTVRFGNTVATYGAVCQSDTWCTTRSPAGKGVVPLTVEVNGVRSAATPANQFTYAAFPTIGGIVPANGPATGGTTVTIIGTNFVPGGTRFDFGLNNPASNVQCTPTQCTATIPAGASVVDVRATAGGFTSFITSTDKFSYGAVVTIVSPNSGPENGGTATVISGAGFVSTTPIELPKPPLVYLGDTYAPDGKCQTPTTCTATSPGGTGTVDVHVVVDGQHGTTTAAGRFTYNPTGNKSWTLYHLPLPPADSRPAMTYDPIRNEILYVAPLTEDQGDNIPPLTKTYLWGWNAPSQTWQKKNPANVPAVYGSAFVFDEANGTAVLFGGQINLYGPTGKFQGTRLVNTTWIWDGTNWNQANPAVKPPARSGASMVYDAARKKIVLFGGYAGGYLNDTWTWDGTNWKQESPSVSPSPRMNATVAYNPVNSSTILFGGSTAAGALADTWAWDGQNWWQLNPTQSIPDARYSAALAYSAADHGLVLYGGSTGAGAGLNDTWIWNGVSWLQAKPLTSPQVGSAVIGMVYDSVWNAVVLVGGGETWTWGGQ